MKEVRFQIGDVVRLEKPIGSDIPAGMYVLTQLEFLATVSRMGTNEDGKRCTTHRTHRLTLPELARFLPMGFALALPL